MLLGRLWEGILRRLRRGAAEGSAAEGDASAGHGPVAPEARPTGFLSVDAFAGELVRLRDDRAEPSPHLQVVSLSDFRRAVGSKWGRLRSLVEMAVEAIIRRNIDPERDIFTRLDTEISCLALPNASRSEVRTRVAAIARDIAAQLFGDAVIDGRRPQVLAANLPLDDALTADGGMDWAAINHALAKAGAALAADPAGGGQGGADAAVATPHRATLASLMTPEDAAVVAKGTKTGGVFAISGRGEPEPPDEPDWIMPGLKGADAPRKTMTIFSALRGADAPRKLLTMLSKLGGADASRRVMTILSTLRGADAPMETFVVSPHRERVAPPAGGESATRHLNGADAERQVLTLSPGGEAAAGGRSHSGLRPESALTLVWTPTWVTGRRAIGAFHARIIRVDTENGPSLEGVDAYRGLAPIEVLTLDRFTATQAARELKTLFLARQKLGLTVPVHWMSLSPKWRDCIRIPFEDCPSEARRRFLKIEVFGLTPSIHPHILRTMFEPLEKIGCDIMARLPLSAVGMIPALSHLRAVGVDLAELTEEERVGDDDLFARLETFRAAARQAKVASYVWGVRRRPLIAQLVAAGFSLVNGPGVMCDLGRPALPSRGA
ncbi:MAG: hypothetical protein EPN20_04735 [Magnetospirillum sp.]|nr:MAG: hypothetical protein EPN20_04735 [Magnetospirillum sp.]